MGTASLWQWLALQTYAGGVYIWEVSIHGFGADQVAKAIHRDENIEAWHVNIFWGSVGHLLRNRLKLGDQEQSKRRTIILFISPKSLLPNSEWILVLHGLAKKNVISMLYVGKAYSVRINDNSFRSKFVEYMKTFKILHELFSNKSQWLQCWQLSEQSTTSMSFGLQRAEPDTAVWRDMNHRCIFIDVISSGNSARTCTTCIRPGLKDNPHQYYLVHQLKAQGHQFACSIDWKYPGHLWSRGQGNDLHQQPRSSKQNVHTCWFPLGPWSDQQSQAEGAMRGFHWWGNMQNS